MDALFRTGKKIIKKLNDNGHEAFFVGGCVRDFYMGRAIQDVDITTDAKPEEVEHIFKKTIDVGKAHGTIIVLTDDIPFEVTTYRTGGAYAVHNPDEAIFSDRLNEDLTHRDFTMNAMAMSEGFNFHDPFNGRQSIENRKISTVGDASARFGEDALRMVRALRFASVLDFGIEAQTEKVIVSHADSLQHVSIERIVTEFKKMYNGTALEHSKGKLVQTGLIKHIPFFRNIETERFLGSRADDFISELIVQVINDDALAGRLKQLKISNYEIYTVKNCVLLHKEAAEGTDAKSIAYLFDEQVIERMIGIAGGNHFIELVPLLEEARALQPALPIRSKKDLKVNGRHLMELFGARSGPWIKECLNLIEKEVLTGRLKNNYSDIINWVKRHVKVKSTSIEIIE